MNFKKLFLNISLKLVIIVICCLILYFGYKFSFNLQKEYAAKNQIKVYDIPKWKGFLYNTSPMAITLISWILWHRYVIKPINKKMKSEHYSIESALFGMIRRRTKKYTHDIELKIPHTEIYKALINTEFESNDSFENTGKIELTNSIEPNLIEFKLSQEDEVINGEIKIQPIDESNTKITETFNISIDSFENRKYKKQLYESLKTSSKERYKTMEITYNVYEHMKKSP